MILALKNKISLPKVFAMLAMVFAMIFCSFTDVYADYVKVKGDALGTLKATIATGTYTYKSGEKKLDMTRNRYKMSSGGYYTYNDLINPSAVKGSDGASVNMNNNFFDSTFLNQLTSSAKQDFLGDVFTIANAVAADSAAGFNSGTDAPTEDTVSELMDHIAQQSGMGSSTLAMLMQNTKPDYVTANRLYEPFSGIVGTILGIVSILVMSLLGATMALDIAYITIPAFQMALGGEDGGGQGGQGSKGMARIISKEAHAAIKACGEGSGGQNGEFKAAVGTYFKYRWKGLVILAICLIYLVQGQIYSLIGWFIDLFSGFLGF